MKTKTITLTEEQFTAVFAAVSLHYSQCADKAEAWGTYGDAEVAKTFSERVEVLGRVLTAIQQAPVKVTA